MAFDYKKEYKELYLPKAKPPLEGFWWQDKNGVRMPGIDYSSKETFQWISMIRLPDFVTLSDFEWAKESVRQLFGIL